MRLFKHIVNRYSAPQVIFFQALFVLSLPNICLSFTEPLPLVGRLVNIILPVSLYIWALSLSPKIGRTVWFLFPFLFLSAFQMVLLYLYGHSVIAVDMFLNLITTNTGEALELLDNLLPSIVFVVLIYVPLLLLAGFSMVRRQQLTQPFCRIGRRAGAVGAAAGLLLLFLLIVSNHTTTDHRDCSPSSIANSQLPKSYAVTDDLYPVNVLHNIWLAVSRTYATTHYAETSRRFTFRATSTHNPDEREIYVLVIGETARAINFQLCGYCRATDPQLLFVPHLAVFKRALTQSNTTHKSVPMLLSAVSAVDFDSVYHQKGIITAFKEAGFHTVFLSNQLPNHSFIDFFGQAADEWKFIRAHSSKADPDGYDDRLLPLLDAVLKQNRRKEFIVLHTYGSHFEYQKRYPRSLSYFKPDEASEAEISNRRSLVNAYDNTIRYTDRLLAEVMHRIEATGAMGALVYASDHGENIFDDSRHLFLHASPRPSYYELHVPLMVWLSTRYCGLCPGVLPVLAANCNRPVATNLSVFHTMIDLAGLRTPYFDRRRSVAASAYRPLPPVYLNDHNEPIPLNRMVTDAEDIARFKQAGIPLQDYPARNNKK